MANFIPNTDVRFEKKQKNYNLFGRSIQFNNEKELYQISVIKEAATKPNFQQLLVIKVVHIDSNTYIQEYMYLLSAYYEDQHDIHVLGIIDDYSVIASIPLALYLSETKLNECFEEMT